LPLAPALDEIVMDDGTLAMVIQALNDATDEAQAFSGKSMQLDNAEYSAHYRKISKQMTY
jgi:hypothetical protein